MKFFPFPIRRMTRWAVPALLAAALTASICGQARSQPSNDDAEKSDNAAKTEEEQPSLNGEVLFATSCGWCHQQGGRAAGRGPKLAGSKRSDEFIVNRIKQGKQGAMPAFEHSFDDEQIRAMLAYIRSLPDQGKP
jgi:mono/diheme cytochrome c family protein